MADDAELAALRVPDGYEESLRALVASLADVWVARGDVRLDLWFREARERVPHALELTGEVLLPLFARKVAADDWTLDALVPVLHDYAHDATVAHVVVAPEVWPEVLRGFAALRHALHQGCCMLVHLADEAHARAHVVASDAVCDALLCAMSHRTASELTVVVQTMVELTAVCTRPFATRGVRQCTRLLAFAIELAPEAKHLEVTLWTLLSVYARTTPDARHRVARVVWPLVRHVDFCEAAHPVVELLVASPDVLPPDDVHRLRETPWTSEPWRRIRARLPPPPDAAAPAPSTTALLTCRLTGQAIRTPAVASDGHTYEHAQLAALLHATAAPRSPWTGERLRPWMARNYAVA